MSDPLAVEESTDVSKLKVSGRPEAATAPSTSFAYVAMLDGTSRISRKMTLANLVKSGLPSVDGTIKSLLVNDGTHDLFKASYTGEKAIIIPYAAAADYATAGGWRFTGERLSMYAPPGRGGGAWELILNQDEIAFIPTRTGGTGEDNADFCIYPDSNFNVSPDFEKGRTGPGSNHFQVRERWPTAGKDFFPWQVNTGWPLGLAAGGAYGNDYMILAPDYSRLVDATVGYRTLVVNPIADGGGALDPADKWLAWFGVADATKAGIHADGAIGTVTAVEGWLTPLVLRQSSGTKNLTIDWNKATFTTLIVGNATAYSGDCTFMVGTADKGFRFMSYNEGGTLAYLWADGTFQASSFRVGNNFGSDYTVALAKLTAGGSNGSMTVSGGIVTAYTAPT